MLRERDSASKITLGCMPANGIVRPLARDRRNECMCVRCSHRKKRHLQSSSAAELHNRSAIHIYVYIHYTCRWEVATGLSMQLTCGPSIYEVCA